MARLIVIHEDQETKTLVLEQGRQYSVGRAADNDIVLNEANLSRHHFKISFENNKWTVLLTASYGNITFKGQMQKTFEIDEGDTFFVSPYTFKFTNSDIPETQVPTASLPKSETQMPTQPLPDNDQTETAGEDDKTFVAEKTSANWSVGVPFITITYPDKSVDTLRMEGEYWVIGRDNKNEIFIDDPKSSRTHAEITKHGEYFSLRDLKSSNGTYFNGNKLNANVPTPIYSGDQFSIGNTNFYFEIKDPHFEEKIQRLPQTEVRTQAEPGVFRIEKLSFIQKKHIQIGAVVLVLLFLIFSGDPKPKDGKRSQASRLGSDINVNKQRVQLDDEQKEYVEKSYKLAKTLYMSQKYELALKEIKKVHELVPNYEDSKEIESYCYEAIDLKKQQQRIELDEQQQKQVNEQIKLVVDECENNFRIHPMSPSQMRECLNKALELDPGNSDAQALISKSEEYQQQKDVQQQNQMTYQNNVQAGKNLYQKGIHQRQQGKLLDALQTFKRHVASTLPDPQKLKPKSTIEIQELNVELSTKVSQYKKEAQKLHSQDKLKDAVKKLNNALELDPGNAGIKRLQKEYSLEVYKNMKALYADSVLEENLGNIEAAKEKWKKIRKQDLPNGEYLEKAHRKLKKYGLEE